MQEENSFSKAQIQDLMDKALQESKKAADENEVPVGCIFVNGEGKIVASSHNLTNKYKNASRHCEINCIEQMMEQNIDISQLSLFVTVQPCIMCAYALNLVHIRMVYFGQFNERFGGCGSVLKANEFKFVGGIKQKQSLQILKQFYQRGNQNIPEELRNKSRKRIKKQRQQI